MEAALPLLNAAAIGGFAVSANVLLKPQPSVSAPELYCYGALAVVSLTYLLGFFGVQIAWDALGGSKKPSATPTDFGSLLKSAIVWPAIVWFPLYMTYLGGHERHFLPGWWEDGAGADFFGWEALRHAPSPLGLTLGLLAVLVGMVPVVLYHAMRRGGFLGSLRPIQKEGAPQYNFWEGLVTHLSQPSGFALLGGYLIGTWMFNLMPPSYYTYDQGINWWHVAAQLLVQDFIQFLGHYAEHRVSKAFYRISHKAHHNFTNPRIFDAFSAASVDTVCMILIPLFLTAWIVPANVWSYMTFGSLFANWLTMIHSEYAHPWDLMFRAIGLGTAADHHVHHKTFKYNFSHLFLYWDRAAGTYRDPKDVRSFNEGV
uniref:Fatty acid hydroxylase domain-containing protein n=1 Tax=Pinguiococcus pyrenoidosus TaxID=172671 RepID=A0A7R9U564_9STRA|mmetsp:Transcript_13159/g.48839  ORF Transcript_13159/g.48839 Transcript_13159/m.48839 type:complete len:371 (+) Transcript_13159:122-1234(+)|eukprot:scaffold1350_cov249-Pinguiococcus_pyrenoidosus.AAC.4